MKHQIFAVYDSKAQAYLPPFFMQRKQMAVRIFTECANAKDHQFGKWPADYTLFHLGSFDDDNGLIDSFPPVSLGNGLEYQAKADLDSDQPDLKLVSAGGTQ